MLWEAPRRTCLRLGLGVLAAVLASRPALAGDATGALAPYEDVLTVVADLTWHLHDDVYRFPAPRDPTGHDLYQLVLHRLENWEQRYPGRMRDVTTFARAEVLERLREYRRAADAYRQVVPLDSPLSPRARDASARAGTFADAAALPEEGPDFEATLAALKKKLDAWSALVARDTGTPYESLARVEEERVERLAAEQVVSHRRLLEDGDTTAERALRFLIEKHADSKELPAHILRLADLYADLARDYVETHDRPLAFDEDEFVQRADRALDTYRKVGTWDGSPTKPEAQARFAAFDAYKTAVLASHR
jgi:hypothetical protein